MTHKTLTIRRGSRVLNDDYGAAVRQRTVRQEGPRSNNGLARNIAGVSLSTPPRSW